MRVSFIVPFLSLLALSACQVDSQPNAKPLWATVDLREVQNLMKLDAEQQNPELAANIQLLRGSYDTKRELRDATYRFTRSAKKQCKTVADQPQTEADKVRGVSAYDACIFDIDQLPDMVKLKQQLAQVEQLDGQVSASKKQLREFIEQQSLALLESFSKGRYPLVLSNRQDVLYNHDGVVLDITEQFKAYVANKKIDYRLDTLK